MITWLLPLVLLAFVAGFILGRRRPDRKVVWIQPIVPIASPEVEALLLTAGADPRIRDSKHDGNAIDWATFFRQPEIVDILGTSGGRTTSSDER